ncbi:hypothetical protein PYCCODRAFT_1133831 [Trametes coccinea BRFM310]|uniref:Uncharacterized protein n=1 Tax=Trametes coccinea (strain BRFM310) TaxID=1353009 RepID=A0A1Y2I8S5_TRAC3|nr:hypothetical protein PYCCODRAFT_1133831 [Trametes coccinea BRFM310]
MVQQTVACLHAVLRSGCHPPVRNNHRSLVYAGPCSPSLWRRNWYMLLLLVTVSVSPCSCLRSSSVSAHIASAHLSPGDLEHQAVHRRPTMSTCLQPDTEMTPVHNCYSCPPSTAPTHLSTYPLRDVLARMAPAASLPCYTHAYAISTSNVLRRTHDTSLSAHAHKRASEAHSGFRHALRARFPLSSRRSSCGRTLYAPCGTSAARSKPVRELQRGRAGCCRK